MKFIKTFLISLFLFLSIGSYMFFISAEGIPSMKNNQEPEEIQEVSIDDNIEKKENKTQKRESNKLVEKTDIVAFDNNEVTFVMLGVDALEDKEKNSIRTDTIMVVKCDFNTGDMKILSIPRDTRLLIKGSLDKVNHAYNYGGVDLTMKTINDFLGTDIEYYVMIDYRAVKEVVDAIGGVALNVPRRMEYYDPVDNFRVDLKKGQQILDGEKSMQYLRWRKNNAMTAGYREGDVGRIEAQQYFLKEFIKQTLSPRNITKLPRIVQTYFRRVDTNIPIKHILNGIALANNLDSENIEMEIIPGYGQYIDDISYYLVKKNQMNLMIEEMGLKSKQKSSN